MTSLKQLKEESWRFYSDWRRTGSYCPAFKSKVKVSLKGWNHIVGQGLKRRSPSDTFRRLNLLPHAKSIIEESSTVQNRIVKGGRIYYVLEAVVNDFERRKVVPKKVRVILIEDKTKNKIFLSVMGKKI